MNDPRSEPGTSSRPSERSRSSSPGRPHYEGPTDRERNLVAEFGPFDRQDQMTVWKAGTWGTYLIEQVDFLRQMGEPSSGSPTAAGPRREPRGCG